MLRTLLRCPPMQHAMRNALRLPVHTARSVSTSNSMWSALRPTPRLLQDSVPTPGLQKSNFTVKETFHEKVGKPGIGRQIFVSQSVVLDAVMLNSDLVVRRCHLLRSPYSWSYANHSRDRKLDRENDDHVFCLECQNHHEYRPQARSKCRTDTGKLAI